MATSFYNVYIYSDFSRLAYVSGSEFVIVYYFLQEQLSIPLRKYSARLARSLAIFVCVVIILEKTLRMK